MSVPPESLAALSRSQKQELLRSVLVERISRSRTAPASFAQERLWFLDRMQGASGAYGLPCALRLAGPLDADALERALGEVVRRHESLRTTFREVEGRPLQVIAPFTGFALPRVDLSTLNAEAREDEVRRRAADDAALPFDLAAGPLFRATLLRLADDDHALLLCMHHVVSDGWSMGVLFRELSALYDAFRDGRPSPLPAPRTQYADYAERQRQQLQGDRLNAQLAYWKAQLAGAPALLELPTDRPRPAVQSHRGAREVMDLSARLTDRLEALGRGERATPYMVLLAAFQVLLGRYAGTRDVVVGTAVSGRAEEGVEELIGFFVNTLALRADLSGDPSFRQVLHRVRAATLGGQQNAEVPFERLVEELQPERSTSHSPLFQVMFTLNDAQGARVDLPGIRAAELDADLATTKFDLALSFSPHARGLRGVLSYSTDLFERSTIRRMLEHLSRLLEQVADDADLPLSRLELMGPAERAQVVEGWNRTAVAYPADRPVHALFAEQARATPAAPAVVFGARTLAYGELNARANRLAHHLRGLGVGAETRVGLCLERGMEMMVSILAVLKAGGAYVPLDLSYPTERLEWMLADAGVAVLLTDGASPCVHAATDARIVRLEAERAAIDACPADDLEEPATPNGLAYVMYTSGSTGMPKGVAVEHRNVVRLVRGADYASFGADEVILQAAPVSFDASTLEIWGALLNGGRVVLMPGRTPSVEELGRAIADHGVTTLWLTAGLFQVMVEERLDDLRGVRQLLAGGDVLPVEAVRRVRDRFPSLRLINGYGPTENTTFTCCHTVDDAWSGGPVPVGSPISNTRVYVLDRGGRPLPIGVPGELFTGGDGVARGYLGHASATAERFVPDPFSATPGARMYRTGDRVRWLADGTVEYLGRLDHQVKIRGFRIEPGEIASVLHRHAAVTDCAVIVREDAPGEKRLVAYVVGQADADALREHLRRSLPEYMVPAAFVSLDALPLTPNGKVDRRALPAPETMGEDAYVAPCTPVEQTLAAIWANVLRIDRVGAADDFFALGGHSLMAMRIVSRVREVFGVELPVRDLFEGPTVERTAERVEALRRAGAQPLPAVVPVQRETAPRLSFAQERLWFLDRMQGASGIYNVPAALRLSGALDGAALERALGQVVRRHQALRTTFAEVDGVAVQVVAPFAGFDLPRVDLSSLSAHAREAEVRRRAAEDGARPFDLAGGPLFRATLLRLADDEHVLLLCIHHAASDGWSMGVLFRELGALYETYKNGAESRLAPLPVQYADFAVWQRAQLAGERLDAQLAYWKTALAGAPALLELPADRPRPAVQSYAGARVPVAFGAGLLHRLETLARREGATLYMVLLGAFQVLLSKYAGSDDVVVGSPVAGRTRREVEELIGFFVNTLALRTDLSGDPSFRQVVRRVRAATLGAHENQDLPFERLVEEVQPERSLSHSPVFQVVFTLEDADTGRAALPGLRTARVEAELATTKFDLTLALTAEAAGLRGVLAYSTDLFDRATIQRMLEHLERVLDQVADDADLPLSRLDLLRDAERAQVLEGWNRTAAAYPASGIHHLFAEQARATPGAVALVRGGETLAYGELNARANRLAHHLRSLGVGAETRVGLCLERGMEMMVSILAILKAGGAYVPLDLSYPAERLRWMLADAGISVLVTEDALRDVVPAADVRVVSLDAERAAIAARPADDLSEAAAPNGLAYVMYTSGSTGTPKGVAVEHRNVVRLVRGADYASFGADEVILQAAPVSFDASTLEIWGALLNGGRVVLMPGRTPSVEELGRAIVDHGVTTLWLTAGLFQVMVEERLDDLRGVRQLLAGGDVLPVEAVRRVRDRFPALRLINGYGPTENTTFTCCHTVDETWSGGPVPVGSPISNTRVYVLDRGGRPLPIGVPGELFTGGDGVARGYLGHASATAERFVPDPFSATPGARMYRTGDRVRWLADGTVEYLGRLDRQVKIRGFRIEPGEVASVLHRHAAVTDCAVIVREDAPGEKRLVAYVVGDADADALREHLRRSLPEYMVPAAFVALDALPLTPNGKVDRRALPAPETASEDAYVAPRTPVEQTLAAIWAEVLRAERVGVCDDFFALGGHSLMAMRIVSRVREVFGVELPVRDLFEGPTVARMAERVEALGGAGKQAAPAQPVHAARAQSLPLSFAQERLWFLDRLQPDSPFYNIPAGLRLSGALDAAALGRALGEIVRRHEALRTTFPEADGRPVQVVHPFTGFRMPVEDLSALRPDAREAQVRRRAAQDAARPFDLAAGPLVRATLLRLADDDHVLLLCMHHVVSDGWSMGVFFRELATLYQAFRDGRPSPLPELRTQYADYALRQRTRDEVARLDAQLAYWKSQLAGAPALLELPADHPRPAVQTFRGTHEPVAFSARLTEQLEALGRAEGATLYMVLLAAFQVLLARHAGRDDVVVGSPVAGRTRPEVEPLIGFFVNTLVLRTDLSGDPSFRDVVRRVRAVTLGAYEHQEVPFERLVEELHPERSLSHSPLVQVSFALRNTDDAEGELGDVRARRVAAELDVTKFDLTLGLAPDGRGLRGGMEYSTDLFERATIRRMLEQLERVLEQAVEHPDRRISRMDLMSDLERARIVGWNRTVARFPADRCIHQLFEAQAARTPQAVAVTCGGASLTYRELDARANRLANHLRRRGVGPEVRVGICLERSLELMVSILGVMKAGGAYVPVDPAHPAERIGYVLGDSGVAVVLTQARLAGRVPAGMPRMAVDAEWDAVAAESDRAPESGVTPENLCYVIYTSGSTGRPKGVAMHHRGVCNYIHWGVRAYGADRGNGSPVFSSMAVDLTITNLLALFAGRPVRLLAEEAPVEALAQALREGAGFGPIKITPVHLSLLTPLLTAQEARDAAHTLVIGADFLAAEPTVFWQENAPGVRLMNEYGPTETVVGCSAYVLPNGRHRAGPVPVGRPIQNLRFYVLDAHGRPVPVGLPGELYIGGVGVARGYLGRAGLSAEKFVPDPFAEAGARMYRTGDRARWLADGNLLILGRTDNQVKIRGYRVELGEIEAELRRHPHVTGAIVVMREDRPGDRRLVAYVVGAAGTDVLREHLRERLPEYMVPSAFVALQTLPQTQTGKVDPRTLPAPEYGAAAASAAPRTEVEERVAAVWREVLGVERVGVHDNFFDLGGTSLLLYRVYSRLRELRADLRVVDLFRHTTVEALAGHLGAAPAAAGAHLSESRSRAAGRRASLLGRAGGA